VQVLRDGACSKRANLSDEQWYRLVTWIDANAPYHDGFVNKRWEPPPYGLPNDRELHAGIAAVHARRCASCHNPDDVTRTDWIDLEQPRQSLFLASPLAKGSGGRGNCQPTVYKDTTDVDYQAVLSLVEAGAQKAWAHPRRDLRPLLTAAGSR